MMKFLQCITLVTVLGYLSSLVSANPVVSKRSEGDGLLKYGYNPPRVNPDYCQGVRIISPTFPGLAFQNGSVSQIFWEVDEDIEHNPNLVTRIRVLNSTQHNILVVGENFPIVNQGRIGFQSHTMDIDAPTGLYHYRLMVNYNNTNTHCVYESIPFMVVQDPFKMPPQN
ncbi:hypothetical protein BGW37DRAFT_499629 [Umbelopsis sp. PMI_123]|nr:hypothetical protein BGW37DRAFT_499629 [Umbelopsis sp. PMI_123]